MRDQIDDRFHGLASANSLRSLHPTLDWHSSNLPVCFGRGTLDEDGVALAGEDMLPREPAILVLLTVSVHCCPFGCSAPASTYLALDFLLLTVLVGCSTALAQAQHIEVWRQFDRRVDLPSHGKRGQGFTGRNLNPTCTMHVAEVQSLKNRLLVSHCMARTPLDLVQGFARGNLDPKVQ